MDDAVRRILERSISVYQGARTYRHSGFDVHIGSAKENWGKFERTVSLAASRPGRCRTFNGSYEILWDGRRRYEFDYASKSVNSALLPEGADAWHFLKLGFGRHIVVLFPEAWVLHLMFDPDPFDSIADAASEFIQVGRAQEDGFLCDILEARGGASSEDARPLSRLHLDENTGLLRRIDRLFGERLGKPPEECDKSFVCLKEIVVDAEMSPSTFEFVLPQGWRIREPLEPPLDPLELSAEQASWIGRPAPDLPLECLESAAGTLRDLRGRVVVIEFWEERRGNALEKISINHEFERSLTNRGVRLVSVVRLAEPSRKDETVRSMIERGLDGFVVLAEAEAWFKSLAVDHSPFTMVLDRDGVVRVMRKRLGTEFGSLIRKELEAILEHRTLPLETPPAPTITLPPLPEKLVAQWSRPGIWGHVVVIRGPDPVKSSPMFLSSHGLHVLDGSGQSLRVIATRNCFGDPLAADLDGDGELEIILSNSTMGEIFACRGDGSILWRHRMKTRHSVPILWNAPGGPLIVYEEDDQFIGLDRRGTPVWKWPRPPRARALVAGKFGCPPQEVLAYHTEEGHLVLLAMDGRIVQEWPGAPYSHHVAAMVPVPGRAGARLILGGLMNPGPAYIMALDEAGKIAWQQFSEPLVESDRINLAESHWLCSIWKEGEKDEASIRDFRRATGAASQIEFGDLDGDGLPEIVYVTSTGLIGVLGLDGRLRALAYAGGSTRISVADFDGDGRAEIFSCADLFHTGLELWKLVPSPAL